MFLQRVKFAFFEEIFIPMGVQEMLTSRRGLVCDNTLVKVTGCVTHIICIVEMIFIVKWLERRLKRLLRILP